MNLPKWLKDILTVADGNTFDNVRVSMVLSTATLLGLQIYEVVGKHSNFDPVAFGSGCAALFAGGAAGIALKKKDEPQ